MRDSVRIAFGPYLGEEVERLGKLAFEMGQPLLEAACARLPRHGIFAGSPELKECGLESIPWHGLDAVVGTVLRLSVGHADGCGQSRVGDHASAEHEIFATGCVSACDGVLNCPDVAVGNDPKADVLLDVLDAVPVSGGVIALEFCTGVDHQFGGAAVLDSARALFRAGIVADAEAHLCRHHDGGR